MNRITLRIPREIHESLIRSLHEPHPFASERIAFCRVAVGNRGHEHTLVLVTEYWSVPDDQYVDDPLSGARINSTAIRNAMQQILDTGRGVLHVHCHDYPGLPEFSPMDRAETPRLVQSFQHVNGNMPHGMLVLSPDSARASVVLPGCRDLRPVDQISIVGRRLTIIKAPR
jgi:hypothetical protein